MGFREDTLRLWSNLPGGAIRMACHICLAGKSQMLTRTISIRVRLHKVRAEVLSVLVWGTVALHLLSMVTRCNNGLGETEKVESSGTAERDRTLGDDPALVAGARAFGTLATLASRPAGASPRMSTLCGLLCGDSGLGSSGQSRRCKLDGSDPPSAMALRGRVQ